MSTHEPPPDQVTPPPPGGYGEAPPPPPPPAPSYGGGDNTGYSLGNALSYGWAKFQANTAQIILSAVVLVVGLGVVAILGTIVMNGLIDDGSCNFRTGECDAGTGFFGRLILQSLLSAVLLVVAWIIGAGLVRASLNVTEGKPFLFSDVIRTDKLGSVVVASVLIAVATFIGTLLCYLPGLVVGFATSYTLYFIIDKDMAPVEAIKASVLFVKDNLANTIVWYIVGGLIAMAGFLVCVVGALVSVPVVLIGTAYTYKTLNREPVAP